MGIIITSVKNPVWANEEKTKVDCVITTFDYGGEQLPFTAFRNDPELHGRQLFEEFVLGVHGPIGDYVPPIEVIDAPIGGTASQTQTQQLVE